jgi:hypothetical protein
MNELPVRINKARGDAGASVDDRLAEQPEPSLVLQHQRQDLLRASLVFVWAAHWFPLQHLVRSQVILLHRGRQRPSCSRHHPKGLCAVDRPG